MAETSGPGEIGQSGWYLIWPLIRRGGLPAINDA
jgi:hypothetical protein